jgi:hypothetical protein
VDDKTVEKFDNLNKSANVVKGGLAVFCILMSIFLFMINSLGSQVDALRSLHSNDIGKLTEMVNEKLSKNGEDHVALKKDVETIKQDISKLNGNIVWVQEFLIKQKEK